VANGNEAKPDWNVKKVHAPAAWKLLDPSGDPREIEWEGIDVGHLDTLYTEHRIFGDWKQSKNWIRADEGENYMEPGDKPKDPLKKGAFLFPGHGTRTASVLCGDAHEVGKPYYLGVAPGLPIIPYRVTNTVFLREKDIRRNVATAIHEAVRLRSDVLSFSIGWPWLSFFSSRPMAKAVDAAYEKGVIIVAAGGQGIDWVVYPAKFWRTIGVGGVTFSGRIYQEYSRDELFIDVWAPADQIYRADATRPQRKLIYKVEKSDQDTDADYGAIGGSDSAGSSAGTSATSGNGDGTSYAAVHVTAAAAMWLRHRGPEIEQLYGNERWRIVEAFRTLIKATSTPLRDPAAPRNGSGYLDIRKLLTADLPAPSVLTKKSIAAGQIF